jgi:threonine dehydratase
MSTQTPAAPSTSAQIPVSKERLEECLKSATFWADELPRYADRNQWWADFWAILAGVVAAITSVAIWPVLSETSSTAEKVVISAAALVAAICALIPRVRNFAEQAGAARELSTRYGILKGRLIDLISLVNAGSAIDQDVLHSAVEDFQSTKEKKDLLRRVSARAKVEKG